MGNDSIKIKGNATIANVSCGLDSIGYSISNPFDILTINIWDKSAIEISISGSKSDSIPVIPEKNTAGKAILSLLNFLGSKQGFKVHIEKGISPGSGMGSSAASAAAAVVGINELLNNPLTPEELLLHGMAGESASAGDEHADNVAPALLGGIVLIRSYNPLDILELPVPDSLFSTIVLPDLVVNTRDARNILPKNVPLKTAIAQAGNLAGFILALHNEDFDLLGRSMVDHLAEPHRAKLIPGYENVRQSAMDTGAIGCGISGSGPAVFALSDSLEKAKNIGLAMVSTFKNSGLTSQSYCSPIHTQPPEILG